MTTRAQLRARVQINRRDPAFVLHPVEDYNNALNEALRRVPEPLWVADIDTSKVTIADTRRYSLATLTSITKPWQVRRVFLEDADDEHYYETGRWAIEDDAGVITLIFDEDPDEADLTIRLEYVKAHTVLSADETVSTMDDDWAVAMATVLLLMQADSDMEDPRLIERDMARFDAARTSRESVLLGRERKPAARVRTRNWGW